MNRIVRRATLDALGTLVYILLVVSLIFSLQSHFSDQKDTILAPIAMLLLFVCSAAITGFLVLGKPAMLYLDGKKEEAVLLLGYTIGILVIVTVAAFVFLFVVSS